MKQPRTYYIVKIIECCHMLIFGLKEISLEWHYNLGMNIVRMTIKTIISKSDSFFSWVWNSVNPVFNFRATDLHCREAYFEVINNYSFFPKVTYRNIVNNLHITST